MRAIDAVRILLAGALLLGALSCGKEPVPCAACGGSGRTACGQADCVDRKTTCTGPCLRKNSGHWEYQSVPGFKDGLLWRKFVNADGSTQSVSQNHWGQVMAFENGRWMLKDLCGVCNGTTRMPCPSCASARNCGSCAGRGKVWPRKQGP